MEQEGASLDELARQEGSSHPYVSSMIKLAYLAPDTTQAILDRTQPTSLTLADLMKRDIPASRADQRGAFGFLQDFQESISVRWESHNCVTEPKMHIGATCS
ncbi:MAG: hypothetical protein JSR91_17295 [Proteobacteria bacterium]|nr:hypothetical protein [Pseudomonadota bacterium]